jgi:hypothetical protein
MDTRKPVAFATVSTAHITAFTGNDGKFGINNVHPGDTVRVTSVGYKAYTFAVYKTNDTVNIYLEQNAILLNNVNITGSRNYKADSVRLRQEFAAQFSYQKPRLKDFLKTNLPNYMPDGYGNSTNNTNAVGGLDLLSVAGFFGRNRSQAAKFQKQLQQDEQDNYVDHVFSKSKVANITRMEGDSLQDFMRLYRPTLKQVKTMTEYELIQYIKTSYEQFIHLYDPAAERDSIFKKE